MLEKISETFSDVFRTISGKASISEKNVEDALDRIKIALLEADVNVRVVRRFINGALEEAKGEKVLRSVTPGQQFIKIVFDRMVALLGDERQDLALKGTDTQSVILLLGLQGSGKTTTAAKLANMLKNKGRKVLLAACDLVRPAAVEQLAVLAGQVGVDIHREDSNDAVQVARNALARARREGHDVIIVDTAGRLQIDEPLMQELVRIRDAMSPVESLLVADAMTGQAAVDIAKAFDEKIGVTGVILTKFDSDTRGGAALSLKSITGKAIKFIGVSERIEGLEPFYPDRIANRILGMGDIVSLVEKAQEVYDQKEALDLERKMSQETFTLEDYLDQIHKMKKMGSVKSMLEMIPGLAGQIDEDRIDLQEMKWEEAILLSMTKKERQNHLIIGPSRRSRIAKGSGTSVAEVNRLLKKFEKSRSMMKKMVKNKGAMAKMFGGGNP
ncbi:Signal recognition particle protein [uncultured spirochete]|jgi:signal recognition particle subunit SRP54|uniref:Signal recognition particle protein n=1 Tax=uncultured spirochete TaxID=156406 RepID=A0A3P3XGW9_9SPIR|nr:signal recognition particle protein [Rectinema subterraneum]SLM11510.1 Signal recognition particle protein [uncultured spirochete]HBE46015.1 signal recognition particle protein [Spirochaetaceae bacterium]HCX96323.1 signal recognition particle protein [Spirochaetaceae bacterium]